jgi:hypothetical protein
MSDALGDAAGVQEAVAAHCVACGSRFRALKWREGIVCPKCHSGHVTPLVAPGGAVDYCVADRSKGYAPADIRFAQWAKWCELITPNQYELAFIKQMRQIQDGHPPHLIHEIMIEEGWITQPQAVRLLEFLCLPRPCEDDGRFVETLRATFQVDQDRLQEVQALQQKAATKYHEVPPLCQLLLERHGVNEAQMLAVLKVQSQDGGYSALRIAREMTAGPAKESGAARVRKALKDPRVRNMTVIGALFLLALGIWQWEAAGHIRTVAVECSHCGRMSIMEWPKKFPAPCPQCKNRMALPVFVCAKGHTFTVTNPYEPPSCPKCGARSVKPLPPEDLGKLEEKQQEKKPGQKQAGQPPKKP